MNCKRSCRSRHSCGFTRQKAGESRFREPCEKTQGALLHFKKRTPPGIGEIPSGVSGFGYVSLFAKEQLREDERLAQVLLLANGHACDDG